MWSHAVQESCTMIKYGACVSAKKAMSVEAWPKQDNKGEIQSTSMLNNLKSQSPQMHMSTFND